MHVDNRRSHVAARAPAAAAAGLVAIGIMSVSAQTPPRPPSTIPDPVRPSRDILDALQQRDKELEAVRTEQRKVLDNEARLKREIESIGDDRQKLTRQLIETASRIRKVEDSIAAAEQRLKPLTERKQALQKSLDDRRAVIIEVLAALQRIGRNPPPAIAVTPEDALQSVRSAIMLGAVLPGMREQARTLARDLAELIRVSGEVAVEQKRLSVDLAAIADDRRRLSLLATERLKQQATIEQALAAERQRAAILGRTAADLRDLIAKIEQSLDGETRAARSASRGSPERKALDARPDLATLKDPGRLAPAVAFATAKGILPLPVNGVKVRDFGVPDGLGGAEKGISISTRPNAQVTAPCDGWVVYAGPFRNYGQLLILNAGSGYHVLLAGMERISADLGQFVLTGEPLAVMGSAKPPGAAFTIGSSQPVLYVEFRKEGTPIDPGPWWAKQEGEKVRG